MNLFDLAAKISLDSSAYESGIKEAESTGKGFSEKLKSGLGTAAKVGAASVVAVGTAAVAVGKKLYSEVSDLAAYGDQIDKNSQKMGISAQAYQEWDFILQHSGSSIDAMSRGMMTLSKQAESNSDAFAQLGITQEELATLNKEELFSKTIEGLQALGEGTERDTIAAKLFGGSAKELGPLLNTSAQEVENMRKQVNDLGGVMSNKAVKDAATFQDSLQDMKTALDGIKRNLTSKFLPSFSGVFKNLAGILTSSGKDAEKYQKGLAKNFGKIASDLVKEIPKIAETAGKIGLSLIDSLSSTLKKNASKFIKSGLSVIKNLSSELVKRIPDLLGGIGSIIGDVISNIPNILEVAWNIVKGLGEGIIKSIPRIAEGIWKGIKGLFSGPLSEDAKIAVEKIDEINSKMEEWREQQEELRSELTDVDKEYGVYEHWLEIYERLREKTSLTKDEEILLKKAVEELNKILPETDQIVQNETGNWEGNTKAIKDNIEAMKLRAKAEIYFSKMNDTLSEMVDLEIQIADEETKLTSYQNELNKAVDKLGYKNVSNMKHEADLLFNTLASGKKPTKEASQALKNYADSLGYSIDDVAGLSQVVLALEGDLGELDEQLLPLQQNFDKQNELVQDLKKSWGEMNSTVERYMTEGSRLEAAASQWETAAHESVDGYIRGLNDKRAEVAAAARGIAGAALQSMRRTLEIASPSKKMRREVGQMAGRGLELGLLDEIPSVEKAGEALAASARHDASIPTIGMGIGSNEYDTMEMRPIYLVLDSGELVGKTVKKYDRALGVENAMQLRWEGA